MRNIAAEVGNFGVPRVFFVRIFANFPKKLL